MPQTMPLNWLGLFILFIMVFILILIKMYYTQNFFPKSKNLQFMKKKNWKW
uniref:ATP synthase F0 subunit 8 n=1 Tax=Anatis ocellata TaxID=703254 RepID=A0A343A3Z1_9CUCU|nr:ATP synthase F0 subunit 8 [Anatis ocellata]AOY39269.1 ATP synthase F0 subunit 8 [Anatis ocellata]